MQQRITSGLTPLPPLQIASALGLSARSTATPGPSASGSHAHPEVAQKAPRSKAGKAQLAAASQKRGWGGGSKGIRLEDSSVSGGAKRKKRSDQPDSSDNHRPQYEDTFEDSDDSTESFDGLSQVLPRLLWPPVPLVPLPRRPSDRWGVFHSVIPPLPRRLSRHFIKLQRALFH